MGFSLRLTKVLVLRQKHRRLKLVGPCRLFGVQEHLPGKLQELRLGLQGLSSCAQASLYRLRRSVGVPTIDSRLPYEGHWRPWSRLHDVAAGLDHLRNTIQELEITSIAGPALSCGNGGPLGRRLRAAGGRGRGTRRSGPGVRAGRGSSCGPVSCHSPR